jgi:hypothetical protein
MISSVHKTKISRLITILSALKTKISRLKMISSALKTKISRLKMISSALKMKISALKMAVFRAKTAACASIGAICGGMQGISGGNYTTGGGRSRYAVRTGDGARMAALSLSVYRRSRWPRRYHAAMVTWFFRVCHRARAYTLDVSSI